MPNQHDSAASHHGLNCSLPMPSHLQSNQQSRPASVDKSDAETPADGLLHSRPSLAIAAVFACTIILTRAIRRWRLLKLQKLVSASADCTTPQAAESVHEGVHGVVIERCCASHEYAYGLGACCQYQPLIPLEPRPPRATVEPAFQSHEDRHLGSGVEHVVHLTYEQRLSTAQFSSSPLLIGDIYYGYNHARRAGWRRKQWAVITT